MDKISIEDKIHLRMLESLEFAQENGLTLDQFIVNYKSTLRAFKISK